MYACGSIFVVFNCGCLVNIFMIIELVQGKGVSANSRSRIKRSEEQYEEVEQVDGYEAIEDNEEMKNADGYEEVKVVEEYEVMDGGETFITPGVQKEESQNDPDEYMDMSGNDTLPPPVVTSQEPPNQTIQQTPSDGECEVRTSDVDESRMYINADPDPSMDVELTKNPAYDLPPFGMLPPNHVNHEGTQL